MSSDSSSSRFSLKQNSCTRRDEHSLRMSVLVEEEESEEKAWESRSLN